MIRTAPGRLAVVRLRGGAPRRITIEIESARGAATAPERREALRQVRHMLRLDEPLEEFHSLCRRIPGYAWVPRRGAGRLLRAPDPFEDLVKLVCTTNCSWSLTRVMIGALVESLGEPVRLSGQDGGEPARKTATASTGDSTPSTRAGRSIAVGGNLEPPKAIPRSTDRTERKTTVSGGRSRGDADLLRAFPTPEAMAVASPRFYRDTVRAGYRAPHLHDLARRVAAGEITPASWLDPSRDVGEIQKEIRSVRGAGPYVAENMMKLLGRYGGLGLDSWCRRKFAEIHARGRKVSDRTIERHYARFDAWRGLALWCDLTRDWLEAGPAAPDILAGRKY